MLVNLNFKINALVDRLQIEAASEQEAIDKLMNMSLAEIVNDYSFVDGRMLKITKVNTDVVEYSLVAKVSNITYDYDRYTVASDDVEYFKQQLPSELTVTITDVASDADADYVEDLIKDEVFYKTNFDVKSLDFEIISMT